MTSNRKWKDIGLGFVGGLLVNVLLAVVLVGISGLIFGSLFEMTRRTEDTLALVAFCGLPALVNGVGIVLLAVRRSWMALGAFLALMLVGLAVVALGATSFWFLFARGN